MSDRVHLDEAKADSRLTDLPLGVVRKRATRLRVLEPPVTQMVGPVLSSAVGTSAHYACKGISPLLYVRPIDLPINKSAQGPKL